MRIGYRVVGVAMAFSSSMAFGFDRPKGIDVRGLQEIAPARSWQRTGSGVRLDAKDGSQVAIDVLADDLVRVRASFASALPARVSSWAVAKDTWPVPDADVRDEGDTLVVKAGRVTVRVQKSPLRIRFLDAQGRVLQEDRHPMARRSDGTVIARKALGFDEHFYGLGEKAARLDKRRGFFKMWNSDTPGYKEGTDPLYQSIPFYLGWREPGRVYGVFFDNSYRSYFDFGAERQDEASFGAEGGELRYYFFAGPTFHDVLGRYTELTGRMPLPPKWALGNQQSRWSYYPAAVAEEVVARYRAADLPLDVLHLDIDYMDAYRVFTWDRTRFPDPAALTRNLLARGVKTVAIVDPGVKHDPGYAVFDEGLQGDYFLRRRSGEMYVGKVWPGESVFVDYTLPAARRWWGDLHRALVDNGVAGIWNDMNEPADFLDPTGALQMDVLSYDEGEYSTHLKNRNVFALLMARATHEGLLRLRPDRRPYVITRAGFTGIQRYATMWTGDNVSTWDALALSLPMFQSLGLSGEAFVGADIGGFIGRGDYELLTRWYQLGILSPFCRNHKVKDGYDHEPFRYPKAYRDIVRKYLQLRYRLLPYLYTALEQAHRTGVPLLRPLVMEYPEWTDALDLDDQTLVGRDLLAAPVLKAGARRRTVVFPPGEWVDFWTAERIAGDQSREVQADLATLPLYVRAGTVLPLGPVQNHVGEKPNAPIELRIYPDAEGRAEGALYEDDGETLGYTRGAFRRLRLNYADGRLVATAEGKGPLPPLTARLAGSAREVTIVW